MCWDEKTEATDAVRGGNDRVGDLLQQLATRGEVMGQLW